MPGHIHPLKRGLARPRTPYHSSVYSPPVVKLTRDLPASDLAKRRIGRSPYQDNAGADTQIHIQDTEELTGEIRNLHELLAAQVLFTGEIIVTDYDDLVELDRIIFPGAFQEVVVAAADQWDQPNVNPFLLIKSLQRMVISKMGAQANLICCGRDAADALEANEYVRQQGLNRLWVRDARIEPFLAEIESSIYTIGHYREVPILCNESTYLDRNGVEQLFFPADTLLVASTEQFGTSNYAAVYQVMDSSNTVEAVAGRLVPQLWMDPGEDTRRFRMSSRFLPCPRDVESWVIAKVI
jgi:hypothetical protein